MSGNPIACGEERGRKMVGQNPRKGLEGQMLGLETGSRIEGEIL